jgi:chemotaxis signal transduction protein
MSAERVLIARVGSEHFAFAIGAVREALDGADVSALPLLPRGVIGQCAHRGDLIPVLDPSVLFGTTATSPQTILVFVAEPPFAIAVDDVTDMITVEARARRTLPAGADRTGMLDGLLSQDGVLAGVVDMATLRATAGSLLTPGMR